VTTRVRQFSEGGWLHTIKVLQGLHTSIVGCAGFLQGDKELLGLRYILAPDSQPGA
jgi:hypothetical protein